MSDEVSDVEYGIRVPWSVVGDYSLSIDVIEWLADNIGGDDWSYEYHYDNEKHEPYYMFYFDTEEDIVAFKLRYM